MIFLKKAWIPGVITENIERDFDTIRDVYKEQGVIYKLEMFDYEMGNAIAVSDDYIVTMIIWYKISVTFEVKMIIERAMVKE